MNPRWTVADRRTLWVVLAVGAALRLALLRAPDIWHDEATVGLMGLAVLRGALPVYFYGQTFMGALDAYLAAPLYFLLGPSVPTLKLVPLGLSLLWMGLTIRLAWEFGSRPAVLAAALLALPPDFLLSWTIEARPHYQLTLVLGTLALLLALRARADPGAGGLLRLGVIGFVLGLAFWTNFLSLVYVPAIALLVAGQGLSPLLQGLPAAVIGFGLGGLPHWIYGLLHGTALPPTGPWIGHVSLVRQLGIAARVSWPIIAGVPEPLREQATGIGLAVIVAALYALAFVAAARAMWRAAPRAQAIALALTVLVVSNVTAAVATQYGERLDDRDQKYFLPVYTALPTLLGVGLAQLPYGWATGVTAALLVVQSAGVATGTLLGLTPSTVAQLQRDQQAQLETIAVLERSGLRRLYATDPGAQVLTFLSDERVIVSDQYMESNPAYARAVDGAERAGWWVRREVAAFEASLAAAGVQFAYHPVGRTAGARVYVDFAVPSLGLRELDPTRLTATASPNAGDAAVILDREARSVWSSGRPMRGDEWVQVDLGRVEPVALIRWLPRVYQETPRGLTLEASLDGVTWSRLVALPEYYGPLYWSAGRPMARVRSGRVELRVPPTAARYLRISQTGRDTNWPWTLRELFVYASDSANTPSTPTPWEGNGAALARAIRAAGVTNLYADHGWASRVALADPGIRVPPANLALDAYSFRGPESELLPRMRWGPGSGVLVEPVDVPLFGRVAHVSGLGFGQIDLGGLILVVYDPPVPPPGHPIPSSRLRVTASHNARRTDRALDADSRSRWTTGRPRVAGDWLRVDLDQARTLSSIRLWTRRPDETAREIQLEGSDDGVTWRPLATEVRTDGPVRWAGITWLSDGITGVRFDVPPTPLRALRLTLTRGDPTYPWSVSQLTIHTTD